MTNLEAKELYKKIEDLATRANTMEEYAKLGGHKNEAPIYSFVGLSLQALMREFKLQMEAME